MTAIKTDLYLGDCLEVLSNFETDLFDLIVTSPPYADRRSKTYGGINPNEYVNWFMPRAEQFLRVLKPSGTFILNIKEKAVNGERHTYVIELILEMKNRVGCGQKSLSGTKKIAIRANGRTDSEMLGKDVYSLTKPKSSICIKRLLWYRWEIGHKKD